MIMKDKILEQARKHRKIRTIDIAKDLQLSRQYISKILNELVSEGKLVRGGPKNKATYALPENAAFLGNEIKKNLKNKNLEEHIVLSEIEGQAPFLGTMKENVRSIFTYAFSEMLNNAMEHSKSEDIAVTLSKNDHDLSFVIKDFGIGVFRNIMKKRNLKSELEAVQDLLKGKVTTAPKFHSGEGIFFTSKISDVFVLESFGLRLRIDNRIQDIFVEEMPKEKRGTNVQFTIDLKTDKHLNQLFRKYQTNAGEYAFDKTEVRVELYTMGTIYISRSQARRVLVDLDKFKSVILDFNKVPTVGQAFADEIFRVFCLKHPEIKIKPINMNKAVAFMVGRVEKPHGQKND